MFQHSTESEIVREREITKRVQAICLTVTSGMVVISLVVATISRQWAEFAKVKATSDKQGEP
jgi:hypothetical protein